MFLDERWRCSGVRRSQASARQAWSVGEIDFSGLVDGYYSLNFNHPASRTNQLRNFDVKANQFSLNMAKLTLEHAADPVGFRVDLGFGRAFDIVHGAETAPSAVPQHRAGLRQLQAGQGQGPATRFRQARDHGRRGSDRDAQ